MRTTALLLTAALPVPCLTQAPPVSAPAGVLSTEGEGYTPTFGATPAYRAQFNLPSLRGSVRVIQGLDLRPDGKLALPFAEARSWSKVELRLGERAGGRLSQTFSANITKPLYLAFSGSVSWPDLSFRPTQQPMPWGHRGLGFNLQRFFVYSGKQDLLLEIRASGGTTPRLPWVSLAYPLDAMSFKPWIKQGIVTFGYQHCRSPLSSSNKADQHGVTLESFAPQSGNPSLDGKIRYLRSHLGGGANTNYIGALGGSGVSDPRQGVSLGGCNPLMISPVLLYPFRTDLSGNWSGIGGLVPYQPSLVGTSLWGQAVHAIGAQGIHVSMAGLSSVPRAPQVWRDRQLLTAPSDTAGTGILEPGPIPVLRIR